MHQRMTFSSSSTATLVLDAIPSKVKENLSTAGETLLAHLKQRSRHPHVLAVSLGVMAVLWMLFTPLVDQIEGVLMAAGFSIIETCFTGITTEQSPEAIKNRRIMPLDLAMRVYAHGYTTWEQFFSLLVLKPLSVDLYMYAVPQWWLRILLFPLVVWLVEIISGAYLAHVWGRRAWHYTTEDARFDGHIRLDYWWLWIILGCLNEVLVPCVYEPIARFVAAALLSAVPVTIMQ